MPLGQWTSRRTWRPMVSLTAVIVEGNKVYRKRLDSGFIDIPFPKIFSPSNIEFFKNCADIVEVVLNRKPVKYSLEQ